MLKTVTVYTTGEQATQSTGGDVYTGILLTFSETIVIGTGTYTPRATLYDAQGNQLVYALINDPGVGYFNFFPGTITTPGARSVVFDASRADNTGKELTYGAQYTLVLDAGFLALRGTGLLDNTFKNANLVDRITIPFTYTAATAPTLSSSTPADGATVASTASNLVLNFGEWIQPGTGNIVLTNTVSNWDTRTIPVTDTTQISISESTLTINPTADLLPGAHYALTMASGVIKDMAGNAFAGITSATTLDFNTPPASYSASASASSVNEGASVTFTVTTANVAADTVLGYSLSGAGITTADLGGAALTGSTTVGANGQASFTLNLSADQLTEGPETLTVRVAGLDVSVTINDTSTDVTAPTRVSASINGALLTLTYNEPLDATHPANLASFTVGVNGLNRQVLNVAGSGNSVTLTLSAPVVGTDSVLISYADPGASNDAFAVQDLGGNDAASFSAQSVNNVSVAAASTAPVLVAASFTEPASGTSSISLVFDQPMQTPSTATGSAPTWFKNGTTPISMLGSPAINGGTLTFLTDTLLKAGDVVTANFNGTNYFRSSANVWAQSSAGVTIGGSANTLAGQSPQGAPVFGNGGDDTLTGNWEALLIGGAGADTLIANGGNTKIFLSDGGTPVSDMVRFADNFGSRIGWTTSVFGFDTTGTSSNDKLGMPSIIIAADTSYANGSDSGAIRSHSVSGGIASFYASDALGDPLLINTANFKDATHYLSQNITTAGTALGFAVDTDNNGSADSLAIFEQNADRILEYQFLVMLRGVVGATLGTSAQKNVVQLVDALAPDLRWGGFTQSGVVFYLSEPIASVDLSGLSLKRGHGDTLSPLTVTGTTVSGNAVILTTGTAMAAGDYVLLQTVDATHAIVTDTQGNTLVADSKGLVMASANAVVDLSSLAAGYTILSLEDGNNSLVGTRGDDGIQGGTGRDTISGGPGNDMIQAASGADSLDGGTGADTFVFYGGDSPLVVFSDQGSSGLNSGDSFNFIDGADIISGGFTVGGPDGDQIAFYNRSAEAFFGNPMNPAPTNGMVTDQHYYLVRGSYATNKFSVDTSSGSDTLIAYDGDLGPGVSQTAIVLSGIAPSQLTQNGSRIYLTTSITDTTPPSLTGSTPADNASAVAIGSALTLSFSEPIKAGSGNIVLTNTANAADTRSISVTDAVQVSINGSSLTVDPAAYLLPGAHYALTLPAGALKDLAGNDFAGVTSSTALDFDTVPSGRTSYTPGQALIDLGSYGKLIAPVQVDGNHWYYFWDVSGNGTAEGTGPLNGGREDVLRPFLDSLFIQDINGKASPTGVSNETYRYATLNGVKVALATYGGPVSTAGVAVQAQDHTLQAGTAIGSTLASGGSVVVNTPYNDLLAVWDAYNGTGTGNTLDGTPPGWGHGNYWTATPSAAAYARFSSSDGLVMLENYGSNTTNLVALEVLSPLSATPAPGTLQGIAYDWKNHMLLSGVSLAASSGNAPPEGSNAPIQFRNIVWGADGIGKAEVWVHAAAAIENFDVEVSLSGVSSKSFTHALGSGWAVAANQPGGVLVVSGFANSSTQAIPPGDLKLGDLSFDSGTGRQIDLHLDFGQAGSVLSTAFGLSLARDTTGADGRFSIAPMQAGSASLAATRSVSDLGNAVNSADALAALKIAVGLNPNPDPDGAGSRTAPEVSPYQIMAANVTGTEGRVTSADALAILRMAVKLPTAPAAEWLFVEETRDFYDEISGKFTLDRTHANWDSKLNTTPSATGQVNLVGVLKGDVDGSWQAPAGSTDLDAIAPSYFSDLAHTLGVPEAQWGL